MNIFIIIWRFCSLIIYDTSPLVAAIEANNPKMVKYLVEKGADVNMNVFHFFIYRVHFSIYASPLDVAKHYGYNEIVEYLIDNGAE